MRIDGAWRLCDDGFVRPVLDGEAQAADGTWIRVPFLLDSGADRTVFSADVFQILRLQTEGTTKQLGGVGGNVPSVLLAATIRMLRESGTPVTFAGQFAAFNDPTALDMSVLGRDITNL